MPKDRRERIIDSPYVVRSAAGSGAALAAGGGGGTTTFVGLTDTPSVYTGDGSAFVRVNSGETSLEFAGIVDADLAGTSVVTDSDMVTVSDGLDATGVLYGTGILSVDVSDLHDELYGLTEDTSNNLQVALINDGGLKFQTASSADRTDHLGRDRTTHDGSTRIVAQPASTSRGIGIKLDGDSGLDLSTGGLTVDVTDFIDTTAGLTETGNDIQVNLASAGGLEFTSGTIRVKLPASSGLDRDSSGIYVDVTDFIDTSYGLSESSNDIRVNLSGTGGLEFTSGAVRVKLPAGSGLDRDGTGIYIDVTDFIDTNYGLTESSNDIRIALAGSTLEFNAGGVRVNEDAAFTWTANHTFDTDTLYVDAGQDAVWVNSGTPDGSAAVKITAASINDYTLYLKQLASQSASILRIEDDGGDALIILDELGNLESGATGFVSGLAGWRIAPDGDAEFNSITARGEFHASTFVMDEIHATTGTQLYATAGRLLNAATSISTPAAITRTIHDGSSRTTHTAADRTGDSSAFTVDVEDPESGHVQIFSRGEALRVNRWVGTAKQPLGYSGYDNWLRINSAESVTDGSGETYYRYYASLMSGTATTLPAGAVIVSYGQSGQGRILATSDLAYGPYLETFKTPADPWNGVIGTARVGRVDGVGLVSGGEQYGMVAGADLSDTSLDASYLVISDQQVRLNNIDITIYDASNNPTGLWTSAGILKLGPDTDQAASTLFDFDPSAGTLVIGNDTSPTDVTVYGSITLAEGSSGIENFDDAGALVTADNLDEVADGSTYGKVKLTALTAAGLVSLDSTVEGTYARVKATAVNASGLVVMDNVVDGTYARVLSTNVTAGQILLSAAYGDLSNIDDGGGYGKVRSTILAAGYIQVGTGTKDSDLSGWHIDETEIVGQDSGVEKVTLNTAGELVAGGVTLDADGISIDEGETGANEVTWVSSLGNTVARIWAFEDLEANFYVDAGGSSFGKGGKLYLSARNTSDVPLASITLDAVASDTTIYAAGDIIFNATGDVRVSGAGDVLTTADEGSGNGLDADTLDTYHASDFAGVSHTHDSRYFTETELQTSGSASVHWDNLTNKPSLLTTSDEGSGNGLDADTVDGSHASAFAVAGHTHDDRYFTESELGGSGTASVHWNNLTNNPFAVTSTWTAITPGTDWSSSGGHTAAYRQVSSGVVMLCGQLQQTTSFAPTTAATGLPAPRADVKMIAGWNGISNIPIDITINTSGNMVAIGSGNTQRVNLDGIYYRL